MKTRGMSTKLRHHGLVRLSIVYEVQMTVCVPGEDKSSWRRAVSEVEVVLRESLPGSQNLET